MWNRREISVSLSHDLPTDGCTGAAGHSDHPAVAMAVMRALRRDGASEHGGGSTPCACAGCAWCWRWGRHTVVVAVAVAAVAVMMMVVAVVMVMMMMMVLVTGRPLVWAEAWRVMAVAGGCCGHTDLHTPTLQDGLRHAADALAGGLLELANGAPSRCVLLCGRCD
jgi:hypothetical protein